MKKSFKATICASCIGYFTQAILINFPPLLFVTFQKSFELTLGQVSLLIAMNFATELIVDLLCSKFVPRIGYRRCVIMAQVASIFGLVLFPTLPFVMSNKLLALIIANIWCGIGGGMLEVLISPIVEACPTTNKSGMMSLLHSFYCWGQMGVVLLSTIYFLTIGIDNWRVLSFIWAIVPLSSLVMFFFVPINTLEEEGVASAFKPLFKNKVFWILFVMMLCAGASEIAVSQWASTFAEAGLGVEKWIGDLIGPCLFAVTMGATRVFFAKKADSLVLENAILISALFTIGAYVLIVFSPLPIISLIGCSLCGVGCGILWPGSFSISTKRIPHGGVAMFGLLALAGDLGCLSGPVLAGAISDALGGELKAGFLFAMLFPILLVIMVL
ncbi:MAG: MFS transporter, partial [Clostridia bacterium]|nr:MFS transporter [Clostridia bacterium]